MKTPGRQGMRILLAVVAAAQLFFAAGAQAQPVNVGNLPGNSATQAATGNAVFNVCANGFVPAGRAPGGSFTSLNTPAQNDLARICTGMVANSDATVGFRLPGNDAIRGNLNAIAHEEVIVQGAGQVELAGRRNLRVIGGRLAELRAGASGFRVGAYDGPAPVTVGLGATDPLRNKRGGGAAAEDFSKLSGFVQASYYWGHKDETAAEDAFKFKNTGINAGVDYRFTNDLVAGVALNYSRTDATVKTGPGGGTDSDNYGLSLYGSHYRGPWYLDAHVNYTSAKFDTTRNIVVVSNNPGVAGFTGIARGNTNGKQLSAGLGTGYNIAMGANNLRPYARLELIDLKIDAYNESGASGLDLAIERQKVKSLQSALGVQFSRAISTGFGVVVPQVSLEWNHEFDNDSRSLTARYVNDPFNLSTFAIPTNNPDRNFFTLSAGASAQFRRGLSGFVNGETVLGMDKVRVYGVVAGVRMEF